MKRFLKLQFIFLLLFSTAKAQHFAANMQVSGDTLIFKLKAVGNFTAGGLTGLELFLRWSDAYDVTFSEPQINTANFPSMTMDYEYNSPYNEDPGYHNVWMWHVGGCGANRSFVNGVEYEVFRCRLTGDVPPLLQLVADNDTGVPYYFVAFTGMPRYIDLTPYYPESPFVNPTGSDGTFFYKDYVFNNPSHRNVYDRIAVPDKKPVSHSFNAARLINSRRQYLQNRNRQLTSSTTGAAAYPNPVKNRVVSVTLGSTEAQTVLVRLEDASGHLVKTYNKELHNKQAVLELTLPIVPAGMYFLNISGKKMKPISKPILVD
jgi:hypothetical protein